MKTKIFLTLAALGISLGARADQMQMSGNAMYASSPYTGAVMPGGPMYPSSPRPGEQAAYMGSSAGCSVDRNSNTRIAPDGTVIVPDGRAH